MKIKAGLLFFVLLILPAFLCGAQTAPASSILPNDSASLTPAPAATSFDMTGFPQWAKDLRRWEIVAFGAFPFAMFTATFVMDMSRWADANGMDISDTGRRYAPWPLKSAGAVEMTNRQYETTMAIAAGISAAVAVADFIIVQIKRHKARQFAESLPEGTAIITRKPWPPAQDAAEQSGAIPDSGEN